MGISRADNFPKKHERWFSQSVLLEVGIEGDILAVMFRLTVRNIEYGPVIDFFQSVSCGRNTNSALGLTKFRRFFGVV